VHRAPAILGSQAEQTVDSFSKQLLDGSCTWHAVIRTEAKEPLSDGFHIRPPLQGHPQTVARP
jgi:hypothetical protein